MAGGTSAETTLQASRSFGPYPLSTRETLPWQAVNSTLLFSDGKTQWKGVRLMYLQLVQHHRSAYTFARDSKAPCPPPAAVDGPMARTEPGAVVKRLVHMLDKPVSKPEEVFSELDWDPSTGPSIVQAQMTGLLLSIIVVLSLTDDQALQQQLHEAGAVQLLCKMTIGVAEGHHHPDLALGAQQLWETRRDVQSKLRELYKLIPVAIASISQATGSLSSFMQDLDDTYISLRAVRQKQNKSLAAKLKDDLTILQHMRSSAAADSSAATSSALQQRSLQQVANAVTLSPHNYLHDLQCAYKCAISGYDKNQTGNSFYWLKTAPCPELSDQAQQDSIQGARRAHSAAKKKACHSRRRASAIPWAGVTLCSGVTFCAGMLIGAAIKDSCRPESHVKHAQLPPEPRL